MHGYFFHWHAGFLPQLKDMHVWKMNVSKLDLGVNVGEWWLCVSLC